MVLILILTRVTDIYSFKVGQIKLILKTYTNLLSDFSLELKELLAVSLLVSRIAASYVHVTPQVHHCGVAGCNV